MRVTAVVVVAVVVIAAVMVVAVAVMAVIVYCLPHTDVESEAQKVRYFARRV